MCKIISVFFLFYAVVCKSFSCFSQSIVVKEIGVFPSKISEASGLEITEDGKLWTHNDGGDSSQIYLCNTTGEILRTLHLKNAEQDDFEDITQDNNGNLYIGDFGNNLNIRKNLRIYKFNVSDPHLKDSVAVEVINFAFPDQIEFPPADDEKNFDCEGLVFFNNNLHIFSKNRGSSKYTKHYRLPHIPGTYEAVLVDSFDTGGWIIGADFHLDSEKLVLSSNEHLWVFYGFSNERFFNGSVRKLSYMESREYEGVIFKDKDRLYLAEDDDGKQPSRVFEINISSYVDVQKKALSLHNFKVFPNPVVDFLTVTVPKQYLFASFEMQLFSMEGKIIKTFLVDGTDKKVDLSFLKTGSYLLQSKVNGIITAQQVINKF